MKMQSTYFPGLLCLLKDRGKNNAIASPLAALDQPVTGKLQQAFNPTLLNFSIEAACGDVAGNKTGFCVFQPVNYGS
jgi:hypothetical protein